MPEYRQPPKHDTPELAEERDKTIAIQVTPLRRVVAPNGEERLTLTFFLQTDYDKTPWELFVEFDGVRYNPADIDYATVKRLVMKDGSEVVFKEDR